MPSVVNWNSSDDRDEAKTMPNWRASAAEDAFDGIPVDLAHPLVMARADGHVTA